MQFVPEFSETVQLWALGFFFVFVRIGAILAVTPLFGERMVSTRVRLSISIAFTIIVFPNVSPTVMPLWETGRIPAFYWGMEVVYGLALGISLRLFVLGLQTAGTIVAQSTSLSQILGAASLEPLPAVGHLLVVSGLALAATLGLHVEVVAMMALSYEALPPGQFFDPGALSEWGTKLVSSVFKLAFVLSAPFIVASILYNLALGAINKAMPQLMVAFVGAPALTAGGLFLMLLAVPSILAVWHAAFEAFLREPFGG